jgi:opacity protein-like surface antigen
MLNGFYDFPILESVELYVGFGIGGTYFRFSDKVNHTYTTSRWVFAYQFLAGGTYYFYENWGVNLGYRLFTHLRSSSKLTKTPYSNTLEAGLRYSF